MVSGDPYELRIVAPDRWTVQEARAGAGVSVVSAEQAGAHVRVRLAADAPGEVPWRVHFAQE